MTVIPPYSFTYASRYGKPRFVILTDKRKGIFSVSGESRFTRGGEGMFDFEGGEMYVVGTDFHDLGEIVSILPHLGSAEGMAAVLVAVKLSRKGRKTIRQWEKANADLRNPTEEQVGGQGLPDRPKGCCGGVCNREGCTSREQVAQRQCQEERIGDGVPPDQVEGGGRVADRDAVPSEVAERTVRKLYEDIVRGNEKRREDFETRFPRVFGGGTRTEDPERSVGTVAWEFGYGWDSLVENLIAVIDGELERNPDLTVGDQPFQIVQMKEKFATLRVYYHGGNSRIHAAIKITEKLSGAVCECCGGIGSLCRNGEGKGGWYKTLCESCCIPIGYRSVSDDTDKYEHDPREQRTEDHGEPNAD